MVFFFCTLFYLTIFREEFEDPGQLQYRISAKNARNWREECYVVVIESKCQLDERQS